MKLLDLWEWQLLIFRSFSVSWYIQMALLNIIIFGTIFLSEIKLEEAAVLHYTYAKFSDLTSRRDRCGCKPTKEDVKRCFMLEFDRAVSLVPFVILVFFIWYLYYRYSWDVVSIGIWEMQQAIKAINLGRYEIKTFGIIYL